MRISSSTIYDAGVASMQQQSARLLQTQQQIASNRRILTPADDPVAAARALEVAQSQAVNQQYGTNSGTANDSVALEEATLGSIGNLLQDVRDIVNTAGNPVLSQSDRASLANDLRGRYQELLGLANSTDGSGQYLFSGYKGGTRPFSQSAPGVVDYNGDQGQRLIQVGPTRQIAASDSGSAVFQRIANGNGTFVVAAGAANAGTALVDAGTVLDAGKWNLAANKDFRINFAVNAGVTTYDIVDNVTGKSLLTAANAAAPPYPRVYTSGSSIEIKTLPGSAEPVFDYGAQLGISGAPANGDSISLKASTMNQDVFKTIEGLANLLQTSSGGAALSNGLVAAQRNLDNAMENILTLRASAGARLRELDSVKSTVAEREVQYSETLSRLQDLDMAKAASDLTQQQVNLQAAQQSFVKVAGLSLFNYL